MGGLYFQEPHSYNYSAKLVKVWGSHTIKTGVDSRYSEATVTYPQGINFAFTKGTTQVTYQPPPNPNATGDPYATFLLGAPDNGSSASYQPPSDISLHYWGGYIQDDYKLNRRITLNIGLRYEFESAPVDASEPLSAFAESGCGKSDVTE